jgi:hypothetical protein
MVKAAQSAAVLLVTLCMLAILLAIAPFQRASALLDAAFGVPPSWTQVDDLYRDAYTQEVTHGENPEPSLQILAGYWRRHPGSIRLLFVGNSQMHTVSLARGESRPTGPEKTYVDTIAGEVAREHSDELVYRLSSSGMSYPEVLWELMYMVTKADLNPNVVVLQMNYQAFWTGGIRDSLLPLLVDPQFKAKIEVAARSEAEYAGVFEDALQRYHEGPTVEHQGRASGASGAPPGVFTPSTSTGYAIETYCRRQIDKVALLRQRADYKDEFAQLLYRCRLYFLNLKPSTGRSIGGSRLLTARSAVVSIADLCTANHIQLLMFYAPVNPLVSLYRTPEDRISYRSFVDGVAARSGVPLYDFENSIPADYWGNLLNGPDPLHMGRRAHRDFAYKMISAMNLAQLSGSR